MTRTLEEVRDEIIRKEREIRSLEEEIGILRGIRNDLERESDEDHFRNPQPGDFWHEMYTPHFMVLGVVEDGVVLCDKTLPVYEDPDQEMVMRSYENPDDPAVKEYFSRRREEIGYTFDLDAAKTVSRADFKSLLKCYSGSLKDKLTYRCIPGRCIGLVAEWEQKQKG